MAFQQNRSLVLAFTACLILVITSAGNFKVSAAAQQYEAKTLEGVCPWSMNATVEAEILQQLKPKLEPTYTCKGTPGWRRVVFINMTKPGSSCPNGTRLMSYGTTTRVCGRSHNSHHSCSSVVFRVAGSEYRQVCGRIRGYQVGSTDAFLASLAESYNSIDDAYVSGISLTYGLAGGRKHIWTFASGLSETVRSNGEHSVCPCDSPNVRTVPPSFVGDDYFCESGFHSPYNASYDSTIFLDDPLWDGQNCTSTSTCCQLNNPSWFKKILPYPTTDNIELRLCTNGYRYAEDIALELIELYIK